MNFTPLTAALFISSDRKCHEDEEVLDSREESYLYREEAFDMDRLLRADELVGGFSPHPALPNIVSLDLEQPLCELLMYTNNLRDLAAPAELCVRKALELISSRANYELNLAAFRMELLSEVLAQVGEDDVDALIQGISCLCSHLLELFSNCMQADAEFFPYEFYSLHLGRYLFLNKITFDANIPAIRPATVVQPAFAYYHVQKSHRPDYFAKADHCIML